MLGVTLLALGPFRHRPPVFWPPLLAVIAFNLAYWTIVPFSCVASFSAEAEASSVVCTSLLGIPYEGAGNYNPPLLPALGIAFVLAALVFSITFIALRRKAQSSPSSKEGATSL